MIAVTAIGQFFTQVLPNVVGDGMRAWLLARLGSGWRNAVTSVVIDRGVGVGLMIALAFGILLLPSALTALAGYRDAVLVVYGAMLMAGLIGLLLVPLLVPILERWRFTREIGTFAAAARRVLIGPRSPAILAIAGLVHALTICIVWSLGRAQGLILPVSDAAVLFTVMVGISIIPVSVGGWGRELAVVSVLGDHGVAPERALLFSVCFGLVFIVGSLPGALAWLLYPLRDRSARPEPADERRNGDIDGTSCVVEATYCQQSRWLSHTLTVSECMLEAWASQAVTTPSTRLRLVTAN